MQACSWNLVGNWQLIEGAGAGVDAANRRYEMLGCGGGVLQWAAGLCAARRCRVSGRRRWLELQGGLEGGEAECARAGAGGCDWFGRRLGCSSEAGEAEREKFFSFSEARVRTRADNVL
ncbi:hypothetical protein RchiOBHm_Chr6g0282401 [Rosa chinensis]|uniref:Uncharacterized protein n=1 Tax=Rosa chinensis TaxID=74649 RepID=A0A2P6PTQ9_ROSCH|nr:hypothetical protein RchiOBHm_Chr6g0282401 [Rosa chinensis]